MNWNKFLGGCLIVATLVFCMTTASYFFINPRIPVDEQMTLLQVYWSSLKLMGIVGLGIVSFIIFGIVLIFAFNKIDEGWNE